MSSVRSAVPPTPSSRRTATLWKCWTSQRKEPDLACGLPLYLPHEGRMTHRGPAHQTRDSRSLARHQRRCGRGADERRTAQAARRSRFGVYHLVSIGTGGVDGTSGNVAVWFMNGTQVTRSAGVGSVATAWRRTAHAVSGSWLFSDQHGGSLRQATLTVMARLLRQPGDLGHEQGTGRAIC
jgi:hypothetical protein